MVFSSLISGTKPAHGKFSSRQGKKVVRVIVHHWAGIIGGDSRLTNPNEAVSATYILYSNGKLYGQVPEEYRPWTSGGFAADGTSITIETQNSTLGPDWRVSPAAYQTLIDLIADIANRYGWGNIEVINVRGHREFAATACPGPYLWPRLGDLRAKAQAKFKGAGSKPTKPSTPAPSKSISELADAVLRGEYGNGADRKKRLGSKYNEVQAEVNRRIYGTPTPSKPHEKSVSQLADEVMAGKHGNGAQRQKSLGARYNEVQAEVNRRVGLSTPEAKPVKVDIDRLAKAVIRGDYGAGNKRKRLLGSNYSAVQKRVNQILNQGGGSGGSSGGGKTIGQLASEVLAGKHGNGDARKKSLGSNYAAVQKEVNRRLGIK